MNSRRILLVALTKILGAREDMLLRQNCAEPLPVRLECGKYEFCKIVHAALRRGKAEVCGIAGLIWKDPRRQADLDTIKAMTNIMATGT